MCMVKNCMYFYVLFCSDEYTMLCLGGSTKSNETALTLIDECALRPGICGGGRCIDTPSGFACDCFLGYEKRKNDDVQVCEG